MNARMVSLDMTALGADRRPADRSSVGLDLARPMHWRRSAAHTGEPHAENPRRYRLFDLLRRSARARARPGAPVRRLGDLAPRVSGANAGLLRRGRLRSVAGAGR